MGGLKRFHYISYINIQGENKNWIAGGNILMITKKKQPQKSCYWKSLLKYNILHHRKKHITDNLKVASVMKFILRPHKWYLATSLNCLMYPTFPATINESLKHIEARIKWPPFCRQHFQMHFFFQWKFSYFNFKEISSNWPEVSAGSGKGLAPYRRQAITLTNDDLPALCQSWYRPG